MKIYVLTDNHASKDFSAEWGLSLLIKHDYKNILFDFGNSDLFLKNAKKLGIDLSLVNYYILSHGHWDHGDGLAYLKEKKKLICHPSAFIKRYRKTGAYIGLSFDIEEAKEKFELCLTREPYMISENIIFLGNIPRITEFESQKTNFVKEDGSEDFVNDDSALAIKSEKGLIVISGCAHSGICNTIEYAREVSNVDRVYAVLGGFHLKGNDELTIKTIKYLKKLNINILRPSHCTQFPALAEFYNTFNSEPFAAGAEIII